MLRGKCILLLLLLNIPNLVFSSAPNFTLDIDIVKDISLSEGAGSNPDYLTNTNGILLFTATNDTTGRRLWKTDGTASGTSMIKNISPGDEFININNILYFRVDRGYDQEFAHELWRSDGTDAGTYKIKKICGMWGSGPSSFTDVNGILYFAADDEINGRELWRSNGTESGTYMVQDLNPGSGGSWPQTLTVIGDTLYFSTFMDSNRTTALYKTNCSSGNTVMLINFGYDAQISYFATINDIVYFRASYDGQWIPKLWRTNGTFGGTYKVTDKCSSPEYAVSLSSNLYFIAWDEIHGLELWKSDGTDAGTNIVKDTNSDNTYTLTSAGTNLFFGCYYEISGNYELWRSNGTADGTIKLQNFNDFMLLLDTDINGNQYFVADDGIHGYELWKSDGTQAGTVLVKDLEPGLESSHPGRIVKNENGFYFSTFNGLWKSDGTEIGTILVKKVSTNYSIAPYVELNGLFCFSADDGKYGSELWRSDGTAAGTFMVKNIMPESSYPKELTEVNSILFFTANDGKHGQELWKSNRSKKGTVLIKDICAGPNSSDISNMTKMNSKAFFTANDGIYGKELWQSDGTEAGTYMVKDICPGLNDSSPSELTPVGDILYFVANDGSGLAIWKSNGIAAGTMIVKYVNDPGNLTAINNNLYFTQWRSELWKSNGTDDGTVMLKDFYDYTTCSLADINGVLYFCGDDGIHGTEVWKSDGTENGTVMIKDINPGSASSIIMELNFVKINDVILFNARTDACGIELWKTDGTEEGTMIVKDINPGPEDSGPFGSLIELNGKAYFFAHDGILQTGLWVTDGTYVGTHKVKSISPYSSMLMKVNNRLYFTSTDDEHGNELWCSDGTEEGTSMVKDIASSTGDSSIENLTDVNGTLYFTATDGITGRELWYARLSMTGDFDLDRDVDFQDFAIFSEQWMLERLSMDISENKGDGIVNFLDWAVLTNDSENMNIGELDLFSNQWLKSGAHTGDIAPESASDGKVDGLDLILFVENWLEKY